MSIGISVVVPVYNAGGYLAPCLDSIVTQDIDSSLVEVIAVDDGSTDGSPAVLDEYAAKHSYFRVIRQDNSGGPGRPRNVGIGASSREYVFFADADDYLAPEALRRMYEFANRHGSDVVSPRLVGDGRFIHSRAWVRTQVDADLKLAFLTMSPQKLFRRSFIDKHGLRFLEGKARFEDGVFVSRAYLTASRVSLLGDYDYYFIRLRADSGNRSHGASDPHAYSRSQRIVIDNIRELCTDRELVDDLVLDLYRRKTLKPFSPARFPNWSDERRRKCVDAARQLAESHIPAELEDRLAFPFNLRSHLARMGDVDALLRHAIAAEAELLRGRLRSGRVLVDVDTIAGPRTFDATDGLQIRAELGRVVRGLGKLVVEGRARVDGMVVDNLPLDLVLEERTGGADHRLRLRRRHDRDGWVAFVAKVPSGVLSAKPAGGNEVWSLIARCNLADTRRECRVAVPGEPRSANLSTSLPLLRGRYVAQPYVTKYGNLAIRIEAHAVQPKRRRNGGARRMLRRARHRVVAVIRSPAPNR